ncbi:MAG TPA: ADP-forming succinate--CoA ligase subunit beta [Thermomicrobiaceae bacterium]|nr:ADP-forming succinate--CoA ligase subunit beta [Thermomicrobiaceae bacterium]
MNIHEYQAAEILAGYGVPVNAGIVCTTPDEVGAAAAQLGGPVVIKAQVHTGGRGKAGGVKVARTAEQARELAGQILGLDIRGHVVHKVLVAPAVDIQREIYLGVVLDRAARGVTVMASAAGGVDIEEVAATTPEKIQRVHVSPYLGLFPYQARALAFDLGIEPKLVNGFASVALKLFQAYLDSDATLAEINPLVLTGEGAWQALDSKIVLDNNALYRHPVFEELRDMNEEVATEIEARNAGISFVKLDGSIGCIVNGAGLAMATMDAVKLHGGEPANFLDVGGGASAQQVAKAFQLVLTDPAVRSVLVNIFGGITRGDLVAEGLIEALNELKVQVPIVVRLVGTNAEEGRRILQQAGIAAVDSMDEAAAAAVAAARGA